MKLDILAFGAHPDDVELSCGGTLLKHIQLGKKAGVIDLTKGELGTRGTVQTRNAESEAASELLQLSVRENLGLEDGFFLNDKSNQLKVVTMIRKYQPEIILCNAVHDRHPDHGKGGKLVSDAVFLAGLLKVKTSLDGQEQQHWRTKAVYHYIQDRHIRPDFVVDISDFIEAKMQAVKAYASQFYNPNSKEPETPISSKEYFDFLLSRSIEMGRQIQAKHGEGFTAERLIGVQSLFDLI
jgi:bacillithiol biosynthesis deacetylase BshB1